MRIFPVPIVPLPKRSAVVTKRRDVCLFVPLGNSREPIALGAYFTLTPSGRWFDALANVWVLP